MIVTCFGDSKSPAITKSLGPRRIDTADARVRDYLTANRTRASQEEP